MRIDAAELYLILTGEAEYSDKEFNFELKKSRITSADDEDGGGHYDYTLKHIESGKLYSGSYTDWDIDNTDFDMDEETCDGRIDLDLDLHEIFVESKESKKAKSDKKWEILFKDFSNADDIKGIMETMKVYKFPTKFK